MTSPLATVTGLTVTTTTTSDAVLDDVELTMLEGEHLGLVGPSGSGKTTLALALLGHLRPGLVARQGRVVVTGVDVLAAAPKALRHVRRTTVAWVGQDPATELTPTQRVGALLAEARPRDRPRRGRTHEDDARLLLSAVGLDDAGLLRRYPHELSGGQLRRVAVARALARRPRLLILDEPTAGLDASSRAAVLDTVAAVTEATGTTMLIVSHDRRAVQRLCAETIHLSSGRIAADAAAAPPRPAPVTALARSRSAAASPVIGPPVLRTRAMDASHGRGRNRVRVTPAGDLTLHAGECTALTGPSGSGKTTLARCLVGLHRPDNGRIELDGHALAPGVTGRTAEQRRAIQLIPQDHAATLHPLRTVGTTLAIAARRAGTPEAHLPAAVHRLLDQVGLADDLAGRRPAHLSGGQRQRVAIARALAVCPRVLICDEITSALDSDLASAVVDLLLRLCADLRLAMLLITHDQELLTRAHRILHVPAPPTQDHTSSRAAS